MQSMENSGDQIFATLGRKMRSHIRERELLQKPFLTLEDVKILCDTYYKSSPAGDGGSDGSIGATAAVEHNSVATRKARSKVKRCKSLRMTLARWLTWLVAVGSLSVIAARRKVTHRMNAWSRTQLLARSLFRGARLRRSAISVKKRR